MTNPLHPEKMTACERLSEVADILARGFLRMSARAENRLDLSQNKSVHTVEPAWKGEKFGPQNKQ
jgi:hypothetical protein